ncbi:MAG: hypothetical protein LBQ65_08900 [Tannerellaceae bacterium]|jgi:hypothetical protein|nr:hypothetical protein [Tannerellaceae bacterium]
MKRYILLSLILVFILPGVFSQSKKQDKIGRAHGETDFIINWKQYYTYDEWVKIVFDLQKKYPNLCQVESIGKSRMGRDMYVMTLTAKHTGKDTDKPAVWVDGAIHGNEVNGITCSLYLAWYLLTRYDYDPRVYESLNRSTVYILPGFNVDGNESYVSFPNTENNPREPFRPVDDDKDGLYDDDMTEDVDGDGELSIMYAEDPSGEYRLSKDKQRFIRIEKGDWWEGTRFRRIGNEGFDNDGDFALSEDDLGGIDPNRNFPWDFTKVNGKSYPLSEPETRNVLSWQLKKKNILVSFNYHNVGRLIMYMMPPEATTPAPMRRPSQPDKTKDKYAFTATRRVSPAYSHDAEVLNQTVSAGLYILKNYEPELGNEYGEHLATTYYLMGAYSFLIELWGPPTPFADTDDDGYVSDEEFAKWVKLDLGGDAWVTPHPVKHPQLGNIWIGGTAKKHIGRTPPTRYIEQEAEKHALYVMYCIEQLPQLSFGNYAVKKVANNLYEVEVEVVNDKVFPTASDRSVLLGRYTPDQIKATVSSGSIVPVLEPKKSEEPRMEIFGRSLYRKEATPAGESVEFRAKGGTTQVFRYTVLSANANAVLDLSLSSATGGKDGLKIKLSDKLSSTYP